jgi:hypothetical protein
MKLIRQARVTCRWILPPTLCLALLACGGGSGPGNRATEVPTIQHGPAVQEAIDELEENVGFRPLAPTYLPAGIDPTPETAHVRDESQQTAILAFFPLADYQEAPAPPTVLDITEDPATRFECPLCPGEGFTELELSGEPALAEEGELIDGVVYYVLYFVAGDVLVTLNAEWDVPDGSGLVNPTTEMKQELVRVADSILVQV